MDSNRGTTASVQLSSPAASAIGCFVLSMTHDASDVLGAHVLAKQAGLREGVDQLDQAHLTLGGFCLPHLAERTAAQAVEEVVVVQADQLRCGSKAVQRDARCEGRVRIRQRVLQVAIELTLAARPQVVAQLEEQSDHRLELPEREGEGDHADGDGSRGQGFPCHGHRLCNGVRADPVAARPGA